MTIKRYRQGQDRRGNPARRKLEFDVVCDQVRRLKGKFIARLQRNIIAEGECLLYRGGRHVKGYTRLTFRYEGQHVTIYAHHVFGILMNCAPIPLEIEVDHECKNRRCVKHLRLIHYKKNASANGKKSEDRGGYCPF